MAAVLNISLFLLSCLWSCSQAHYCYYYDDGNYHGTRCSDGCCTTGTDATIYNVCCDDDDNSSDSDSFWTNNIIGILVGVGACVIFIAVVIVVIACCCLKRRPQTKGRVIMAPNPAAVYSNNVHPGSNNTGVAYPPHGTNNPPWPVTVYSDPPPSYETVTPAGQDNKGFDSSYDTITSPEQEKKGFYPAYYNTATAPAQDNNGVDTPVTSPEQDNKGVDSSYETVTSPEQDKKGLDTHVNMN